jgi:hypothetical protein
MTFPRRKVNSLVGVPSGFIAYEWAFEAVVGQKSICDIR